MTTPALNATREIMWNTHQWFSILMYFTFSIALGIFLKGLHKKLKYVANGPISNLFKIDLNWSNFFKNILLQGKVNRQLFVAFFHGFIFFGFIILIIATTMVAIQNDFSINIFQGLPYKIISLLADYAGVAIFIGVCIAFFRRYIQNPSYLDSTRPKQEIIMYLFILNFIIVGFILEGIRILNTGLPTFEAIWSPIGFFIAQSFAFFHVNNLDFIYKFLWLEHMLSTMIFIALLPNTKFIHTILAPLNSLIATGEGAILTPMDFENEDAETFGLGKISELTLKNRLDTISCVECGRCSNSCPAKKADKILDPKTIITKLRDYQIKNDKNSEASFWDKKPLYGSNELDACTTCGACMEECPMSIEHVPLILEAKRYKVLTLGEIPKMAADATNKVKVNGNPWGIAQHDRFKWAEGLEAPVIKPGEHVEYLYFLGCAGSYDSSNQQVVKDTIKLLKKGNINFALLGEKEKCCGDPVRRFGDEYSFYEIALENISLFNQYSFDKIIVHCPHCLHTVGKEYNKYPDANFKVIHHSELLSDMILSGSLIPQNEINENVTYHDPCYIGRHDQNYDKTRSILKNIKGIKIKEMDNIKDKSLCCGMGGGNMWYELPEGEHLGFNRLREIGKTKVNKLITACSYCLINFNSNKDHITETKSIEIEDIATILEKSIN